MFSQKELVIRKQKGGESGLQSVTIEERVQKANLAMEERIAQREVELAERQADIGAQVDDIRNNVAEAQEALERGDFDAAIEINARISVPKVK